MCEFCQLRTLRSAIISYLCKYADLSNSMLCMHGHVSVSFFAVTSYSSKVNAVAFVILLQVYKVNFLNR